MLRHLLLLILCFPLTAVQALQLEDLRWHARPLLIFSASLSDPQWLSFRSQLNEASCELEDRQVVLGKLRLAGESTLSGQLVSNEYAASLFEEYGVSKNDFTVILLGKDGHERFRTIHEPEIAEIFALIDRMPMRRIEMKKQPSHCITVAE